MADVSITLELLYYVSPEDTTPKKTYNNGITIPPYEYRYTTWNSDEEFLKFFRQHIPAINPRSVYVISTANREQLGLPYQSLQGSVWPTVDPQFLVKKPGVAVIQWKLKEVSQTHKAEHHLKRLDERVDKLSTAIESLATEVKNSNEAMLKILEKM